METKVFIDKKTGLLIGGSVVAAGVLASQPVLAQDPIADLQTTLGTIGGIAATAGGIVVVAMGIRLAIKQVNRVMTKG